MSDDKTIKVPDSFNDRIKGATLLERPVETYKQYWQATYSIITEKLSDDRVIQLIKYVFGVPFESCGDFKWIQQAYIEFEPFFTMNEEDNRELLRHLCAAVISYTIEADNEFSEDFAQLVSTSSLTGLKPPFGNSPILELSGEYLLENSMEVRVRPSFDDISVSPIFSEVDMKAVQRAEADAGEDEGGDEKWKDQLLTRLVENSSDVKQETEELHEVIEKYLDLVDEEVNVLWWILNGFSNQFDKLFAELDRCELIFSCGIELAEMSPSIVESPSFRALIRRASISDEEIKLTDFFVSLLDTEAINSIEDVDPVLQPVLYGLVNQKEKWVQSTGIDENCMISELNLTTQLFREFSSIK